ncbi:MAG: LysE family translocator [Burkholderiaceae bacterium]
MSIELWLAFVAASAVLLMIPGPTILTVISYSIAQGPAARLPLVAAVALGDSTALLLSLIGLGGVLATSALAFEAIKWAGGLYLIYLALRMLRAGIAPQAAEDDAPDIDAPAPRARLFVNTYLVTALNPKGIVFFVAFLPQFIRPQTDAAPQLWLLAATFVTLAALNAALYASFAQSARRLLSSPAAQRRFNLTGAGLLAGAGLWALLARRP